MLNRIGEVDKEDLQIKFKVIVITCGFHCNKTTISTNLSIKFKQYHRAFNFKTLFLISNNNF